MQNRSAVPISGAKDPSTRAATMSGARRTPRVVRIRDDAPDRRQLSPLAVLFLVTAVAMAIQYLVLLAILIAAERWNRPFGFQVALGPIQFWQAHYTFSQPGLAGLSYQVRSSATGQIREGALLVSFIFGALVAVIQAKRVPASASTSRSRNVRAGLNAKPGV
jgi:hypothetical protein